MSKHMSDLKFTSGKYDALPWSDDDHPACTGLVYLDVEADDSFISGWVKPEIARLVKAAPELLNRLRVRIDTCVCADDDDFPTHLRCEECKDDMALIAKAAT